MVRGKCHSRRALCRGYHSFVKIQGRFPLLLGIPNFSDVRIHAGNTVKDTQGCILVGENKEVGKVFNSRKYVKIVKQKIVEAKDKGEGVWIEIR